MEAFTIIMVSAALICFGILIALIKILTAVENNNEPKERMRKIQKLILINGGILLLILAISYAVTSIIA